MTLPSHAASSSSSTHATASASTSGTAPTLPTLSLTSSFLASLRPSKAFAPVSSSSSSASSSAAATPGGSTVAETQVTSLHFDDRGDYCVAASQSESLVVYHCRNGKQGKTLYSKKYGVHLARFTHRTTAVVYASTKEDDTIRHHSLADNTYLQYYRGHKSKVISLQMSPLDDSFLSSSVDESVRLWDLRSPNCQGMMRTKGHTIVNYDPTGTVFALIMNEMPLVLLYDVRKFDFKPFLEIQLPQRTVPTSVSFTHTGLLLVGTASKEHHIVCSKTGAHRYRLCNNEGFAPLATTEEAAKCGAVREAGVSGQEVTWTPDGKFVVSGSASGKLYMWAIPEAEPTTTPQDLQPFSPKHQHVGGSARAVAFNPRNAMIATAGTKVNFWLPPPPVTEE